MPVQPGPEGTKYVRMEINFWYEGKVRGIHVSSNDVPRFHVSLIEDPDSRRGHPTLYNRLKTILQEQGRWAEDADGESQ